MTYHRKIVAPLLFVGVLALLSIGLNTQADHLPSTERFSVER